MAKEKENEVVLLVKRIRASRVQKGLTQQEFGEKADINYKTYGINFSRGKRKHDVGSF